MFLASGPAAAWTLTDGGDWTLPGPVESMGYNHAGVVLLGEVALWVVAPLSGTPRQEIEPGGRALLLHDWTGAGASGALFCRDDGLWWVPPSFLGSEQEAVTTVACDAVVPIEFDGQPGLATASTAIQLWDREGALVEALDIELSGPPMLASRSDGLLAAAVGDPAASELGPLGISSLAAGGAIAGLGVLDGLWAWTLSDAWSLASEDGRTVALPAEPGLFLTGELDGDEHDDLLVLHPAAGAVSLVRGLDGEVITVELGRTLSAAALTDLDGDGCDDLLVADNDLGQAFLLRVEGCGTHIDHDGDGYSVDDGDCDDSAPEASPAGFEVCDGLDNDCDGRVDEPTVALDHSLHIPDTGQEGGFDPLTPGDSDTGQAPEGGVFVLDLSLEGCYSDETVAVEASAEGPLWCEANSLTDVRCRLTDQGPSTLALEAVAIESGEVLDSLELDFGAYNVAPTLLGLHFQGCGWEATRTTVHLEPGDKLEGRLLYDDPGDDQVTLVAEDAPYGPQVSPDGHVHFQTASWDTGVWEVEVELWDEDGGRSEDVFTVLVKRQDPGGCSYDGDGWDGGIWDGSLWGGGCSDDEPDPGCGASASSGCLCGWAGTTQGFGLLGLLWVAARRRRAG